MTEATTKPIERYPASLVGKIVYDLQVVGELQLELARAKVHGELKKRLFALSLMALGGCLLGLFAILSSMSLVHLLHRMTSPAKNSMEGLPLWACFAIIASGMALTGLGLCFLGMDRFRKCALISPQALLKE
ncbi:phage holin family protein [Pirellulaceae bacterium SH449]